MRGKAVACAVALTLVLGGCGPSALNQDKLQDASAQASQAGVTVEQIKERGYLLVGTAGDYCPLSMREDSGTYWGLDADLAQDLACDLGVELRYVETSWPTILDDTVAGKFDLALCCVSRTDERMEKALISDAYLVNGKTALMRAEDVGKLPHTRRHQPVGRTRDGEPRWNQREARTGVAPQCDDCHPR